jgi:hypothetical protein
MESSFRIARIRGIDVGVHYTWLLAFFFALWPRGVAEARKAPVRIGAVHNLSGPLASIGQPSLAGARLAVRQLNERGGYSGGPSSWSRVMDAATRRRSPRSPVSWSAHRTWRRSPG